jgi:hypothetical protein
MRDQAQQLAIETAVRKQLQTEAGRDHARAHLKELPQGPSRRRLFELLTEAEIVHGEGG